jgi:hypothetical protein
MNKGLNYPTGERKSKFETIYGYIIIHLISPNSQKQFDLKCSDKLRNTHKKVLIKCKKYSFR